MIPVSRGALDGLFCGKGGIFFSAEWRVGAGVAGDDWRGHLFIGSEAATPPGSGVFWGNPGVSLVPRSTPG